MKTASDQAVPIPEILDLLDRAAPSAPLLALGQTVFWDEPMKAALAVAVEGRRRFVAGVHDTDYFAKLPGHKSSSKGYAIIPHNDTTTRDLWSAAAEFSSLFGSETVVRRDTLVAAGLKLAKVSHGRPNILDSATEAWGWRTVVSLSEKSAVTSEVDWAAVRPHIEKALSWAIDETLACVSEPDRVLARERADLLLREFEAQSDHASTLSEFYQRLIPFLYRFVSGKDVAPEVTATSELLKFNSQSCILPRFDLVNLFVDPDTALIARDSYDQSVSGSEIYTLDRFGSGAVPFDLVVPGQGRGTLRVAPRSLVVMTPTPIFISLKKPVRSVQDLAEAIENKLGPDCVLAGKAVSLIGMLSREFVFVFHEGASSYVQTTRRFHDRLKERGAGLRWFPILRLKTSAWTALSECRSWIRLPEPLRGPFGSEEICTPSFAARWKEVAEDQARLLDHLAGLKSPLDLIKFLDAHSQGSWKCLSDEYVALHERLQGLEKEIEGLRQKRRSVYSELKSAKQARVAAEVAKGEHFRTYIWEKAHDDAQSDERAKLTEAVEAATRQIGEVKHEIRTLMRKQAEVARDQDVLRIHERRREIETEAELKRLKLIRDAVIASKGLQRSNRRPSAWWFPVVCPDGGWFAETARSAECYLEPLES